MRRTKAEYAKAREPHDFEPRREEPQGKRRPRPAPATVCDCGRPRFDPIHGALSVEVPAS